jgi:AcrR family transcriptional regulator
MAVTDVQQRREAILAAARRCLADCGYDRVRLRDISRESGVSIGLIQHYFDNRDALLRDAFDASSADLIEHWSSVVACKPNDPWSRIVALVDALVEDADLRRHCITWTQYCVVASREPALRAGVQRVGREWRQHLEAAIADGVQAGTFQPVLRIDEVLDVLLSQVDGCELMIASGMQPMDGPRLRHLFLSTAALLLGQPAP